MSDNKPGPITGRVHLLEVQRVLKGTTGRRIVSSEIRDDELFINLKPEKITDAMKFLRDDKGCKFDYLRCLCGVDYRDNITIVYHLYSLKFDTKVTVKVPLPKDNVVVESVTKIWAGADWHERETAEMFGVTFAGHPDPRKLLMKDDYDEHPLKKDFKLDYGD